MRLTSFSALCLALGACAEAPPTRGEAQPVKIRNVANWSPASCASDPELAREQMLLLQEINRTRDEYGLGPVRYEPRLAAAAHEHACANARAGVISHTGPGGTRPGQRALRAGYDYKVVAENLGLGFHGAKQAMFYWMRSPGHRTNVLKPEVRDAALGLTVTAKGQRTWVLMLGKTR